MSKAALMLAEGDKPLQILIKSNIFFFGGPASSNVYQINLDPTI